MNENGSPNEVNSDALSTLNNTTDSLVIYPNPVINILHIVSNYNTQSIKIRNLLGQLILVSENKNFIDLSSLETGIYLIEIENTNSLVTKRIIKK